MSRNRCAQIFLPPLSLASSPAWLGFLYVHKKVFIFTFLACHFLPQHLFPPPPPTKLHSTWDLHSARNNSFISRENPHRNPYIKSVPVECYQTGNANKHFHQSGHGTTRSMFKLMITTCLCDDFVCLVGLWSARRRCGPSTAISGLIFLRGENGGGSFIGITCACCTSCATPRGA